MAKYKFPWPERFECDRLPEKSTDEQLCMDPQEQSQQEQESMAGPLGNRRIHHGDDKDDVMFRSNSGDRGGVMQEQELRDHGGEKDKNGQCSCRKCQNG